MQKIETSESVLLKLYQFTVFIRTIRYGNEVFVREPDSSVDIVPRLGFRSSAADFPS